MNLLNRLHNWAHRQDENFLTEAFAHLCCHLLVHAPEAGVAVLANLTDGFINILPTDAGTVTITTQVTTAFGRPDLQITAPGKLSYVEVKSGSGLGHLQLERYRQALKLEKRFAEKQLVLLTRYPVDLADKAGVCDCQHRWHEIYDWLEGHRPDEPTSVYVIKQFKNFLRKRNISMEKVEWNLVEGTKAMRNLLTLISEAINHEKIQVHRATAGWDWIGYYLDEKKSFIGFYFDNPDRLRFEAYLESAPPMENVTEGALDGTQWNNHLDLLSEETYFFSRSKPSQMQLVIDFLRKSYDYSEGLRKK